MENLKNLLSEFESGVDSNDMNLLCLVKFLRSELEYIENLNKEHSVINEKGFKIHGDRKITAEDVLYGYNFLLKRNPENMNIIEENLNNQFSFNEFRDLLWGSSEFKLRIEKILFENSVIDYLIKNYTAMNNPFYFVLNSKSTDSISNCAFNNCVFDEVAGLLGLFDKKGVFLDIGANIGAYSLIFASEGWKVFSIEASEENFKCLEKSIKINEGFDITLDKFVLHEHTGTVYFKEDGPWGYVSYEKEDYSFAKAKSYCLNDYKLTKLKDIERLDLIKMDIEGSEPSALKGMDRFLNDMHYPAVYCEVNVFKLYLQGKTHGDLFNEFQILGYAPYKIDKNKLYLYKPDIFCGDYCTDYLFIHENNNLNLDFDGCVERIEKDEMIKRLNVKLQSEESEEVAGTYILIKDTEYAESPVILNTINQLKKKTEDSSDFYFKKLNQLIKNDGR